MLLRSDLVRQGGLTLYSMFESNEAFRAARRGWFEPPKRLSPVYLVDANLVGLLVLLLRPGDSVIDLANMRTHSWSYIPKAIVVHGA